MTSVEIKIHSFVFYSVVYLPKVAPGQKPKLYPSLFLLPLRGSPSLGGYGCPNPEVPRVLYSLPVYPPLCLLLFAAFFYPSTASEGALHEKLLPLCLLLASHGQPKPPRVGRAWRPFGRVVHCWSPVYQFGWYPNHLVSLLGIKRKGHSLGLGVKGGQRSWR
ncbi:hypothetical protein AVEN_120305-1 [Araneus ventricosus]|uniref:Uncharacterized protein n=1 Tax=Araneus ventricosus TaxID=182803 RepID=A0A4Y2R983_ARAVE|nr:hypothetical protein AVEN_120305-1 [Araneus ventricosus]